MKDRTHAHIHLEPEADPYIYRGKSAEKDAGPLIVRGENFCLMLYGDSAEHIARGILDFLEAEGPRH